MTKPSQDQSDAEFTAQAFSALPAVEVSAALMRRVAQIPLENETAAKVWYWPFDRVWQPSLALAALALMGVLTGSVFDTTGSSIDEIAKILDTSPPDTMPNNSDTISADEERSTAGERSAALGDDEELDNLLALALGQSWQESVWEPATESTSAPRDKNQEDISQ